MMASIVWHSADPVGSLDPTGSEKLYEATNRKNFVKVFG